MFDPRPRRSPQHAVVLSELLSALRLQRTQRAALTVSTGHNACVIHASLVGIAEAASEAKRKAEAALEEAAGIGLELKKNSKIQSGYKHVRSKKIPSAVPPSTCTEIGVRDDDEMI